jgi:hypothetical protein
VQPLYFKCRYEDLIRGDFMDEEFGLIVVISGFILYQIEHYGIIDGLINIISGLWGLVLGIAIMTLVFVKVAYLLRDEILTESIFQWLDS